MQEEEWRDIIYDKQTLRADYLKSRQSVIQFEPVLDIYTWDRSVRINLSKSCVGAHPENLI